VQQISTRTDRVFLDLSLDTRVLAFTIAVALTSGILSGIAPAAWSFRKNVGAALHTDRTQTVGRGHMFFRSALVATEVALSLVLLIGAGLLIRSFDRILKGPRGFQTDNRLVFAISLPDDAKGSQYTQFLNDITTRASALPGVVSVAAVSSRPLVGIDPGMGFGAPEQPDVAGQRVPWASWRFITSDYFRTMGIPLLRGRTLTEEDATAKPKRVVISQNIAQRLWPGQDPIGRPMTLWKGQNGPEGEVVGVVADMRERGLDSEMTMVVYLPYYGSGWNPVQVVVQTSGITPDSVAPALRTLVHDIDPALPISDVETLDTTVSRSLAPRRFNLVLLSVFAAIALLLTVAGVFGVLSFTVASRTPEIGVRLALGATRQDILSMVFRNGMTPVLLGAAIGVVGALTMSRVMSSLLFEVPPRDPLTYAAVSVAICATALAACYLPARRALRVDPMHALRND